MDVMELSTRLPFLIEGSSGLGCECMNIWLILVGEGFPLPTYFPYCFGYSGKALSESRVLLNALTVLKHQVSLTSFRSFLQPDPFEYEEWVPLNKDQNQI